jgi:hypothetical protein
MVPTLSGRIQTRIFSLVVVGSLWLLIISPFLPQTASVSQKYQATFLVLGLVIGVGIAWELIYHGLQQFRWEKDWPALFTLVLAIPEGIVVWVLLRTVIPDSLVKPNGASYIIAFATVWLVVWMFLNGPMRVPAIHWRFRGGRVI